jgi:FkbM family methyltransferase
MDLLVRSGFVPGTVIDIGVAAGTPWLYDAFPKSKLVLIDPLPLSAPALADLRRKHDADVYRNALGAQAGELVLNYDEAAPSSSSLLSASQTIKQGWEARGVSRRIKQVTVPVMTLDDTISQVDYQAPFLIKIDTEGYELEVLKGADASLQKAEVVISEVAVMRRFEGSYEFAQLVRHLDERGFRLFDLLDVKTFGRGGPINYLDAAFVRRDGKVFRG